MTDIETVNMEKYPIATQEVGSFMTTLISLLGLTPLEKGKSLFELLSFPQTFYEAILFDNFRLFLKSAGDKETGFDSSVLSKLGAKLAEGSPNDEGCYPGNVARLREYAKKIVKIIWECDSEEKATYIANLTRAFIVGLISKERYFKLSRCIATLSENDLQIIRDEACEGNVVADKEYIEEFSGLGLMYPVAGGSCYSKTAFGLCQFAIKYEDKSTVSVEFQPRAVHQVFEPIQTDEIENMLKNSKL